MKKVLTVVFAAVLVASAFLPSVAIAAPAGRVEVRMGEDVGPVRELPSTSFALDHASRLRQADAGRLGSAAVVPLNVEQWAVYPWQGRYRLDGFLSHALASTVANVVVTVEYQDAHGQVLKTDRIGANAVLMPTMYFCTFSTPYDAPVGTTQLDISAEGEETTESLVLPGLAWMSFGFSPTKERYWSFTLQNTGTRTIVAAGVHAIEWYAPPGVVEDEFMGVMTPLEPYQQRLAPGESVDLTLWGVNPESATLDGSHFLSGQLHGVAAPPTQEVYRFMNRRTGTHFYTVDPVERDDLVAKYGWLYAYEGPAFCAYAAEELNTLPLYRFFNVRTGTHFYTADADERDRLIATASSVLGYEGVAFYICDSGGLATQTAYRFHNKRTGAHFYTVDTVERDEIVDNLGWLFELEGAAFNAPVLEPPSTGIFP